MADLDLRAIWQQQPEEENSLAAVQVTAQQFNKRSLNLVEKIKSTARAEHRTFLIIATLGLIGLLVFGQYVWTLSLLIFVALMIWKYEAEMRSFNRIQPGDNTLAYLKSIQGILHKFMRNYRIGIALLTPIAVIGGILFRQWIANRTLDATIWSRPQTWLTVLASIALGILLSRLWLNFWVNSLYGRKLKEMGEMIVDLSE